MSLAYVHIGEDCISGLQVNEKLSSDWTAIMYASQYARVEIVRFLLDHGADPNYSVGE